MEEEEDQFAKIKHVCEYSSSQEERFRNRPLCRESEAFSELSPGVESSQGDQISVACTEIMICSPPETPSDGGGSPSDEFQTPQENLQMSSQEQTVNLDGSAIMDDDHHKDLQSRDKGGVSDEDPETHENASKDVNGRRELPASIRGGKPENASKDGKRQRGLPPTSIPELIMHKGCSVTDGSSSENMSLVSLLDSIIRFSVVRNATSDLRNDDILETVEEQRGMKFSRPRWWPPPEGF